MAERNDELAYGGVIPPAPVERLGADADAGASGAADADPAAMRAEIRETRARVGETLEAIGERLNPQHIKAQVRDNIRDATIGRVQHMAHSAVDRVNETRSNIVDTIRENPIPAAMIGIGLGWLFINGRRQGGASYGGASYGGASADRYDARYNVRYAGEPRAYAGYPYGSDQYGAGGSAGQGEGAIDRARERAGEVGRDVRDTAGQLVDRAQHAAGAIGERAQEVASTVADRTRYQARRVEDRFYETPLVAGAATLALGLAAGLAIPATEREVALMGDARDRLVDRAREVAQETTEKVQHVAGRVMDEVKTTGAEAARSEGLTT
jgi:ElaB/YqjD/DUF883 family membrane-anchored ribosome-binding protein